MSLVTRFMKYNIYQLTDEGLKKHNVNIKNDSFNKHDVYRLNECSDTIIIKMIIRDLEGSRTEIYWRDSGDTTGSYKTDWGDGEFNNDVSHCYKELGDYIIESEVNDVPKHPILPSSISQNQNGYEIIKLMSSRTDYYYFFSDNNVLKAEVVIPDNVENIEYMFDGCSNLTGEMPIIPAHITSCARMLCNCSKFNPKKLYIPPNVINASGMFAGCSSLTYNVDNLVFPSKIEDISSIFSGCKQLTGGFPNMPNSILNANSAFRNCTLLTGVPTLPTSLVDASSMFGGCVNLTGIVDFTNTGNFNDCSGMFSDCINLTGINGTIKFNEVQEGFKMLRTFNECTNLTGEVKVTGTIGSMEESFYRCHNLKKVDMTGTKFMPYIDLDVPSWQDQYCSMDSAFEDCWRLEEFTYFPQGVYTAHRAFWTDYDGVEVLAKTFKCGKLPESLIDGMEMFNERTNLVMPSEIYLPNLEIGKGMFYGCTGFTPNFSSSKQNFQNLKNADNMFQGTKIKSFNFELKNIISLYSMFNECRELESIGFVLNENTTSMESAFYNCRSLTKLPEGFFDRGVSVRSLEESFWYTSITNFPRSLKHMTSLTNASGAFANCKNLTHPIELPDSVENCEYTFRGCPIFSGSFTIPKQTVHIEAIFNVNEYRKDDKEFTNDGLHIYIYRDGEYYKYLKDRHDYDDLVIKIRTCYNCDLGSRNYTKNYQYIDNQDIEEYKTQGTCRYDDEIEYADRHVHFI